MVREELKLNKILAILGLLLSSTTILGFYTLHDSGYSIYFYNSAPSYLWITLTGAFVVSVYLLIKDSKFGGILGGFAIVMFAMVPVLRGFYLLGSADALVHLGWVRDLLQHQYPPFASLYPGLHIFTGFLKIITDFSTSRALMITVPIFALLYYISFSTLIRRIYGKSMKYGFVIALFPLPIFATNVPVFQPLPTTVGVLYSPLFLLLLTQSIRKNGPRELMLLIIGFCGLLLYHPQHAFNFIIFLTMFTLIAYNGKLSVSVSNVKLSGAIAIAVLGVYYLLHQQGVAFAAKYLIATLLNPATLNTTPAGTTAATAGKSFTTLMFLVAGPKLVIVLLASLGSFYALYSTYHTRNISFPFHIGVSSLPVCGIIAAYLAVKSFNQALRYVAFLLIIAAIIAPTSLKVINKLNGRSKRTVRIIVAVLLVISLVAAIPTSYRSPIIDRASMQVTESQIDGYALAFSHTEQSADFTSLTSPNYRYHAAIYGTRTSSTGVGGPSVKAIIADDVKTRTTLNRYRVVSLPPNFGSQLSNLSSSNYYISVTKQDYAKQDLNPVYASNDFTSLDRNGNKLIDTGGYYLYYVRT